MDRGDVCARISVRASAPVRPDGHPMLPWWVSGAGRGLPAMCRTCAPHRPLARGSIAAACPRESGRGSPRLRGAVSCGVCARSGAHREFHSRGKGRQTQRRSGRAVFLGEGRLGRRDAKGVAALLPGAARGSLDRKTRVGQGVAGIGLAGLVGQGRGVHSGKACARSRINGSAGDSP